MRYLMSLTAAGSLAATLTAAEPPHYAGLAREVAEIRTDLDAVKKELAEIKADKAKAFAAPATCPAGGCVACPTGTCTVAGQCGTAACGTATGFQWKHLPGVGYGWVHDSVPAGYAAPASQPVTYSQPVYSGDGCTSGNCCGSQGFQSAPLTFGGFRAMRGGRSGGTCSGGGCN